MGIRFGAVESLEKTRVKTRNPPRKGAYASFIVTPPVI